MPFQPRRAPRARLLLAVAAFHLLLLVLLRVAGVGRDRGPLPPATEPLVLRLLTLAPPPPAPEPTTPTPPARASRPTLPTARPVIAAEVPAAAALPAPPVVVAEPALPASAPARPLLLDLPRRASEPLTARHPGLDDPNANSPRPTLESRIARAVGSDRLTEQNLGDGRLRFRKGSGCVEVRQNTAGQLEPFNESARPSNRLATNC